jgi:hypothetical protein
LEEQSAKRAKSKQTGVRHIQDAALSIVEVANREHESRKKKGYVPTTRDDYGIRVHGKPISEFPDKCLRIYQMLDNVQQ